MTIVADKVSQVFKDLTVINPLWCIKHDCGVDLIRFLGFYQVKIKSSDSFIFEDCSFEGDLDVGDVHVLISDVD